MKDILDFIGKHFTTEHLILLFILLLIAIALFVFLAKSFQIRTNNLKNSITQKHNLSHLKIDLLNKTIYLYETDDLTNASQINLKDFLNQFQEKDAIGLNRWLLNQLNKKTSDSSYKEIINYSKKNKLYSKDIFLCTSINLDRHTLHVDHYITYSSNFIKADYEIERNFFKLKKKSIIDIGLISFFVTNEKLPKNKTTLNPIQNQQIIEKVLKHCDNRHLISVFKNGDIGLIILQQRHGCQKYLNEIKKEILVYLQINKLSDFSFNIAMIKNIGDKINYQDCLKKVRLLSNYLLDNKQFVPEIVYYNEKEQYSCRNRINQIDKIKRAIFKNEFVPNVVPFFTSKDGKVAFHQFQLLPKDETLASVEEITEVVYLNNLQNEYLTIFFDSLSNTYNESVKDRTIPNSFLISISLWYLDSFIDQIEQLKIMDSFQIICSINNCDFENDFDDDKLLSLQRIKDAGCKFAIELDLLEKPRAEILSLVDYILLDETIINKFFKDETTSFLLTNYLDDFKKSKITIVVSNLGNWSDLESMICNFASIISATCLEQENRISLGLNKKVCNKLKGIYYKYH